MPPPSPQKLPQPAPERRGGRQERPERPARSGQAHRSCFCERIRRQSMKGGNEVEDPDLSVSEGGRVAPERGGPSRERRPPRLSGAGKQRRRVRAVLQTCSCQHNSKRSARFPKKKNRTLEGSAMDDIACANGADGACRPPVGANSYLPLIQSARGANMKTPSSVDDNQQCAALAPAHHTGRCGVSPQKG